MAVTGDPFVAADLAGFIGEIWPGIVYEEMFAKAVAANFFTDLSEYMRGGGDIIHVPDVFTNSFSGNTQSTQGAEVTTEGPAQVDNTLTVNTHSYVAYIIGDKDMVQLFKNYDYNAVYTKKAAGFLRHKLEDAIFGLWSDLSTNTSGDTATVLSDAEIRVGIEKLEALYFDTCDGDTAFFFHPYTFYIQLAATQKFYDQSMRGPLSAAGFIATGDMGAVNRNVGLRGVIYGIPAYVSARVISGLQTYLNLLANKEAFAWATQYLSTPLANSQEQGRVRAQAQYQLRNIGWLTVVDMIYGVKTLRETAACLLNGSSAFIGS